MNAATAVAAHGATPTTLAQTAREMADWLVDPICGVDTKLKACVG